ncbi:ABC transporter permease subunit [Brumicola pallidula]|uniref:Phosphate transport system permease protein n=1 Tax=Brumicola pallidula DSM 14239 = ACAM 615 TaxID=1121922 RepID=K6ZPQ6_9ALTE|nr:ABC transporter permease subunit [Glaciecola pallidula]GAC30843.1 phosphate transport system permease protein [Glaciecola pallidula DSM 14239 = ACAM 615]
MNQQEQHQFNARRFRKDWITRKVVTGFGWLVLATFLLIIWHIFSNAYPLFKSPNLELKSTSLLAQSSQLSGIVELSSGTHYMGVDKCDLILLNKQHLDNEQLGFSETKRFPFSCQHQILFLEKGDLTYVGVITPNHLFELYKLSYEKQQYSLILESSIGINAEMSDRRKVSDSDLSEHALADQKQAWQFSKSGNFVMLTQFQNSSLSTYWFDKKKPAAFQHYIYEDIEQYQAIPRSRQLLTISKNIMSLVDTENNVIDRQLLSRDVMRIFLSSSQRSFFTQDRQHVLSKWIMLNEQGSFVFRHNETDISELDGPIEHMAFDTDSNAAVVVSKIGNIAFLNRMTNEMFRVQDLGLPGIGLQWFGARLYVFERHKMHSLEIQNLQGITTLKSLFSEVWYEGYEQPAYVWQTSSASENYETKFSIVPLIVGSLKASFLALFVAIPLALGAAIYTSYFADPAVRQYLKPAIEMLEAVPSVVIGFIAAVWMVPIAEEFLLSVILFIVSLPILLVTAALLQSRVATVLEDKFDRRWEILVIILAVVLLGLFCFSLSDVWRFMLLGSAEVGEQKDNILNISKTTIVVAIALGVAISPSIYSLAEDALFEVPESIKQASFALGATKLQTLRRVIIAVAMPSILSAVMLGFGRAFGETMIVLMVTGNTPISDWNILEGLRSMTANLAIELQESSVNSTHFNTLFLTASILFIFTFIVNTAAEILRNRLRKVYTDA